MHSRRGQGSFEYLLLLGGTILVATVVLVMAQGSVAGANNAFNESTNDYSSYIQGGVNDVLVNGTLIHEQPSGCMYGNPACGDGYYCGGQNACVPIVSALLSGYVFDYSGIPLSGATVRVVGGVNSSATTNAAGYYSVSAGVSQSSGQYSVVAARSPANAQSTAVVNLTVGYASMQNFTLGYNPASLSGYVRDPSSAGISGATVTCGSYSVTTASGGSYSIGNVPMSSATLACTLAASKSPAFVPNSAAVTLNAGVAVSKDLQLSYTSASLSGYVRNPSGVGVSGAGVSCGGVSATTAGDGSYSIGGVAMSSASSTCTLAGSKSPTFVSNSVSVVLNAGTTTSGQNLQLSYASAAVSGYVRNSLGVGLGGASVSCAGYSATTGSDGAYSISGIVMSAATSTCTLAASKPGYSSNAITSTLAAGTTASGQNVQLQPSVATLTGYVRDPSSVGIGGASVSCAGYSATTAGDGSYAISGIAMGSPTSTCTLLASKAPTYSSNSVTATLTAGATTSQSLQLSYARAAVFGYVRDASSAGVGGAGVSCAGYSATTASDGSYTISGIPMSSASATCAVSTSKSGYPSAASTPTVALSAGVTARQDLQLKFDCTAYGAEPYGTSCLWYERHMEGRTMYFTLPPNFATATLSHAGFDDNGNIQLNDVVVYTDNNGCCSASEYDVNVDVTARVHAGSNKIYGYNDNCCGLNAQVIAYITYG